MSSLTHFFNTALRSPTVMTAGLLLVAAPASAQVIAHNGDADPKTEGWTENPGTPINGVDFGPIDDGGTPAWMVDDNEISDGSSLAYTFVPSAAENAAAAADGWTLSGTIRAAAIPDSTDFSVILGYDSPAVGNGRRYLLAFGAAASGNGVVAPFAGNFTDNAIDVGSGGYHDYDLVFDPVAGSADLFVDGTEVFSDFTGIDNGTDLDRVIWGSASSATPGHGNYNAVSFSVNSPVPEPASLGLLGSGALMLMRRRRHTA